MTSTKRLLLTFTFGIALYSAECQTKRNDNFWRTLSEVSFVKSKDKAGLEIDKPVFSTTLRSFHGKKIILSGYIIPLNELNGRNVFMFSALPFSTCYFCGGAGPETVVEVEATKSIAFVSKKITLEGTLLLNENDIDHHIFILKSASIED